MARVNNRTDQLTVAEVLEVTGVLKGKTFSITGHLGRPRKEVIALIEQAGGRFEERPRWGWGERYLITNQDFNANSTILPKKSSKMIEAEKNGWELLSEDEFIRMLGVG